MRPRDFKGNSKNFDRDVWIRGAGFDLAQIDCLENSAHAAFADHFQKRETVQQDAATTHMGGALGVIQPNFRRVEQNGRRMRDLWLEERIEFRQSSGLHGTFAPSDSAISATLTIRPGRVRVDTTITLWQVTPCSPLSLSLIRQLRPSRYEARLRRERICKMTVCST